jgi:hypothetical protein
VSINAPDSHSKVIAYRFLSCPQSGYDSALQELELINADDNLRISSALSFWDVSVSGQSRTDKRSDSESNFFFMEVSSGMLLSSQSKHDMFLWTVNAFERP